MHNYWEGAVHGWADEFPSAIRDLHSWTFLNTSSFHGGGGEEKSDPKYEYEYYYFSLSCTHMSLFVHLGRSLRGSWISGIILNPGMPCISMACRWFLTRHQKSQRMGKVWWAGIHLQNSEEEEELCFGRVPSLRNTVNPFSWCWCKECLVSKYTVLQTLGHCFSHKGRRNCGVKRFTSIPRLHNPLSPLHSFGSNAWIGIPLPCYYKYSA